ncbi:MAG TPA: hypothetical protein VKG25_03435, partial [Bryobacteraceae bacterium]|nr:hypothetical protein [Bryobacteraceae bacterium]
MKPVLCGLLLLSTAWPQTSVRAEDRIVKEVRHELVMLPYYSVFDNLAYKVDGNHVTLFGQVTRPTLKATPNAPSSTLRVWKASPTRLR